ncbi:MAG: octaprenyl diphosphate synthase [Gammaproteobacteria bacterium]|nr:octaprenyl diphosphate synthase [Gammaproteobacteria bacterium]
MAANANKTLQTKDQKPALSAEQSAAALIKALTRLEARAVDQLILKELSSNVVLINQIGQYIVNSGGKRLRPMLHILAAKALDYRDSHHITMAAVIEFIHTATLLHDDVVDESDLRRGQDTANAVWGNAASVLVGDFLYSRSFEMMVSVNNMQVLSLISKTTTAIAEGEVLQLLNCNNPKTSEQEYLDVIRRKTAILFAAATELAAVLTDSPGNVKQAMRSYGLHLGTTFQLIDDVLDYRADPEKLGKNLGDDLAEGKPTLPLIHAMSVSSPTQSTVIENAIKNGNREAFHDVMEIINSSNAIQYTENRAQREAELAIESLKSIPDSKYKDAMITLAESSVNRSY